MVGSISTTVTLDPSRRHTEPSSRPTAPAPITTRLLGTDRKSSASVEETTRSPSKGRNGSSMACEPIARQMFRASISAAPASPVMEILPPPARVARAVEDGDLVLLHQHRDAVGELFDDAALAGQHRFEVEAHGAEDDPVARRLVASLFEELGRLEQRLGGDAPDVEAGAAEGAARFSIRAVLSPSWAARMAHT